MRALTKEEAKVIEAEHNVLIDIETMTVNCDTAKHVREVKKDTCYGWKPLPKEWRV